MQRQFVHRDPNPAHFGGGPGDFDRILPRIALIPFLKHPFGWLAATILALADEIDCDQTGKSKAGDENSF